MLSLEGWGELNAAIYYYLLFIQHNFRLSYVSRDRNIGCMKKITFWAFFRYTFYKFIWAPLLFMHQPNLESCIYKIKCGKFIYHMDHEREILGVWKISSFMCDFCKKKKKTYLSTFSADQMEKNIKDERASLLI